MFEQVVEVVDQMIIVIEIQEETQRYGLGGQYYFSGGANENTPLGGSMTFAGGQLSMLCIPENTMNYLDMYINSPKNNEIKEINNIPRGKNNFFSTPPSKQMPFTKSCSKETQMN